MSTVVEVFGVTPTGRGAVASVYHTGTPVHVDTNPSQFFWPLEPGSVAYSYLATIVQIKQSQKHQNLPQGTAWPRARICTRKPSHCWSENDSRTLTTSTLVTPTVFFSPQLLEPYQLLRNKLFWSRTNCFLGWHLLTSLIKQIAPFLRAHSRPINVPLGS